LRYEGRGCMRDWTGWPARSSHAANARGGSVMTGPARACQFNSAKAECRVHSLVTAAVAGMCVILYIGSAE
jgi:hypothetical protein